MGDAKATDVGDAKTTHASSLFMAADNTMITVGGGLVTFRLQLASSRGDLYLDRLLPRREGDGCGWREDDGCG